ncbi:MAG: signal peptide peptidase SppA [Patescibacteria group bacterium]
MAKKFGFQLIDRTLPYEQRRRKFAWLVIGIVTIIGLVVSSLSTVLRPSNRAASIEGLIAEAPEQFIEKTVEGSGNDKIVLLRAEGVLVDGISDFDPEVINIERLAREIDQAKNDSNVKAVVLLVNSPGGSITASDTIYKKIIELKAAGKKVVVLMREVAASGGYYISSPADKIIANQGTLTGSIGVILQSVNVQGLFDKVGLQPVTFKAGKFKDLLSPTRAITDDERQLIQALIDEAHGQFITAVADGRKIDRSKIVALADGRVFSGTQAKQAGLIDDIGNLPEAIKAASDLAGISQAHVVEYSSLLGGLESFFPFLGFSGGANAVLGKISPELTLTPGLYYLWLP